MDATGNVYIADSFNNVVRVVAPSGVITTFAGGGTAQSTGSGIAAISMRLGDPYGIAVDGTGNVYIAASTSFQVFKVSNGIITTFAGNGTEGYSGNGGPAVSAWLDRLGGVGVDSSGNVHISEWGNHIIWEVSSGTIQVIAGNINLPVGNTGNGGPATSASFNEPMGLAVGGGSVYIADTFDNVIRELTPAGSGPPAIESGGVVTSSSWGDFNSAAPGSWIEIYGSNLATASAQWAASNFTGSTAPTSLNGTSVTIGGVPAFVEYVSSLQVNAQVPSNVGLGTQQVVVTTPSGATATSTITIQQTDPGLLAPASFLVTGTQYVVALFSDNSTYVMPPGAISGVTSRAANPGEVITLYGVGFGTVTPGTPAGQIASPHLVAPGLRAIELGCRWPRAVVASQKAHSVESSAGRTPMTGRDSRVNQCQNPTGWLGRLVLRNMNSRHSKVTDWGLSHASIGKQDIVLDVGCGGGRTVNKLAAIATQGKIYGIDHSTESVAITTRTNKQWIDLARVEVREASVSRLPFADGVFDVATAVETHFWWSALPTDLREVLRVLKPGGKLIIIAEVYKGSEASTSKAVEKYSQKTGMALLSVDEHRGLLTNAGYADVQVITAPRKGWICCIGSKPPVS